MSSKDFLEPNALVGCQISQRRRQHDNGVATPTQKLPIGRSSALLSQLFWFH